MTRVLPNNAAYDSSAAQYHLTLRYNPLLAPKLPRIGLSDMRPSHPVRHSSADLQDMLVDSMGMALMTAPADARIMVALSGGVDSALMIALLCQNFPDLNITAVTVQFDDAYNETERAAHIANSLGTDHVVVDVDNYLRDLPAAIHAVLLPMWDLHWYHVVKEASAQSADILVSGNGGDELFGGYTFRYKNFLKQITELDAHAVTPNQKIYAYLNNHIRDFVHDQDVLFGSRMNFSWDAIYNILYPYFNNILDPLEQVFLADYNGKMLYNFDQVDKSLSSYFGIKTIAPLLSPTIIRYAMQIRADQKYDPISNIGKMPLRSVLQMLGIEHLVSNVKAGFSPNTVSYWRKYGYDICSSYLDSSTTMIVCDDWINRDWILAHLRRDLTDIRYINKFLGLLAFEIWYRIFITKDIDPNARLT